jgi:hypothetical protein
MADTVTIATESLADLGVTLEWQNDNSVVLKKGWLVSVMITPQDAEQLYIFVKTQRTKAGLPL